MTLDGYKEKYPVLGCEMKQEYVQLAHVYDPKRHSINGWYLSEKLDGTRAIWDGGISRGLPVETVPYANTIKDGRYTEPIIATGLWSRAGKVIQAPDWFLDKLPNYVLDGELWMGYNRFQELRRTVSGLVPGPNWSSVRYLVFDLPSGLFFNPRDIKIRNDYSFAVKENAFVWAKERGVKTVNLNWNFDLRMIVMSKLNIDRVLQKKLSLSPYSAQDEIEESLVEILGAGGEGVVIRNPVGPWTTERSKGLLKYKPFLTDDAVVTGYTAGEGKYRGMIGALVLDFNGKSFKLSGITDEQREILDPAVSKYAAMYCGQPIFIDYDHHFFPRGSVVEFKYRELSDDGIPKESRFFRVKR